MKLPRSYYNYISYLGTIVALIAWATLIFFVIQIYIFKIDNVYFDLYTFIVTPVFLVLGHILIPLGMYRRKKKIKKGIDISDDKFFVLNLRDAKTRNAVLIFSIISVFFVISTIIGSYKAFHYTESVEFCGTLCHKVMKPEYVAYQNSPHARVKCAECHVGEGADFYVQSKMSGLRQVYKYILGTYPRPIATPIENLRPARETCEKCHWPQKFYTNSLRKEKYFLADSANSEFDLVLNMKIGANHQALGLTEGIHWHINPDFQIDYKSDAKREKIYWVKVTNKKTGVETVFNNMDTDAKPEDIKKAEMREMDCMDCHNRPSHEYRSPTKYLNDFLASDVKFSSIPWLKSAAVEALRGMYSTTDSASAEITKKMIAYYKDTYPEFYKKFEKEITLAIVGIKTAYFKNVFPEMKVNYSVYPRHIGHLETDGCFRCHNNNFKSTNGKVISKDCNLCHTILAQGIGANKKFTGINSTLEFEHPVDIGDAWKESNCKECHADLYK